MKLWFAGHVTVTQDQATQTLTDEQMDWEWVSK